MTGHSQISTHKPVQAEAAEKSKAHWLYSVLFTALIPGILFLPAIRLVPEWPTFHATDFLVPFIVILLVIGYKKAVRTPYYIVLALFAAVIFLSILLNHRLGALSDYFEILKVVKFGLLIFLCSATRGYLPVNRLFTLCFIVLCTVNLIQYFQLFHINTMLVEVYGLKNEVWFFGKDSLGGPATKRMFGLTGNPNNNAIIFLFFIAWYFNSGSGFKANWQFYLAVLMLFLCQSKSGIMAFGVLLAVGFWYCSHSHTDLRRKLAAIAAIALISLSFNGSYVINGVREIIGIIFLDKSISHSTSLSTRGRWEVWHYLVEMILHKPLIGHAPYKSFFYERSLYSENEYILMAWRYGIAGLAMFICLLAWPLKAALKARKSQAAKMLLLFGVVIIITGFTNNPFSNRDIHALFAVAIGAFLFANRSGVQQAPLSPTGQAKY